MVLTELGNFVVANEMAKFPTSKGEEVNYDWVYTTWIN